MRKNVFRIGQIVFDLCIAIFCVNPLITDTNILQEMEWVKTCVFFAIPIVTVLTQFWTKNLNIATKRLLLLLVIVVLAGENLLYIYIGGNEEAVCFMGTAIATGITILYADADGDTPQSLLQVGWSVVLSILVWEYLRKGSHEIPGWGIIAIALFIPMLTTWIQCAGKYQVKSDLIVGVTLWGLAVFLWAILDHRDFWSDNRLWRFGLINVLMTGVYLIYLHISEEYKSSKKKPKEE